MVSFKKSDVAWLQNVIRLLNDGGEWGIPRNNSVWKFHKKRKVAELIIGDITEPTNAITWDILKHLKWEVKHDKKSN